MATTEQIDRLVALRRDLHRHPEPAWREFYTTARVVEELERIGVDELLVGEDVLDSDYRWGLPDDPSTFEEYAEQAKADGAPREIVDQLADGHTGVIGILDRGPGPHVALRVDIDALFRRESDDAAHHPAKAEFRSRRDGLMHACGHDAHATIGVGVLERIAESDFSGKLSVCFQPAEEVIGGGKAMAESGQLDDVDYLIAIHLGLDHPTGEIVAGFERFLAVSNLSARFIGAGAHAGVEPHTGRNAVHALATATQELYGIARHGDGLTRVNVGEVSGGSASNIVPEAASLEGEVRGGTTELREYMKTRARTVIEASAAMHDCEVDITFGPEAPGASSDPGLAQVVEHAAGGVEGVTSILPRALFTGSEDATYLMQHVQERGGLATYVGIGTDHPTGHHTATFDVDEESIRIGVDVLSRAIRSVASERPSLG